MNNDELDFRIGAANEFAKQFAKIQDSLICTGKVKTIPREKAMKRTTEQHEKIKAELKAVYREAPNLEMGWCAIVNKTIELSETPLGYTEVDKFLLAHWKKSLNSDSPFNGWDSLAFAARFLGAKIPNNKKSIVDKVTDKFAEYIGSDKDIDYLAKDIIEFVKSDMDKPDTSAPWRKYCSLQDWDIIGMNHYYLNGQKYLYVGMTKQGRGIVATFRDDESELLWLDLARKAEKINDEMG